MKKTRKMAKAKILAALIAVIIAGLLASCQTTTRVVDRRTGQVVAVEKNHWYPVLMEINVHQNPGRPVYGRSLYGPRPIGPARTTYGRCPYCGNYHGNLGHPGHPGYPIPQGPYPAYPPPPGYRYWQ
jgi:hypothetical protein